MKIIELKNGAMKCDNCKDEIKDLNWSWSHPTKDIAGFCVKCQILYVKNREVVKNGITANKL
jgi:hypothetical protein